jgi:hypothetical protein
VISRKNPDPSASRGGLLFVIALALFSVVGLGLCLVLACLTCFFLDDVDGAKECYISLDRGLRLPGYSRSIGRQNNFNNGGTIMIYPTWHK